MRSQARNRERVTHPAGGHIKWFVLHQDLDELSNALAWPCKWDEEEVKWVTTEEESAEEGGDPPNLDRDTRNVYSTIEGVTAATGDFVPCWYNTWARRWEVIAPPGPKGVKFRNDASQEAVPPYGVMRVTGHVTDDEVDLVTIDKPDTSFQRKYLVNGRTAVPAGETGIGTWLSDADWVQYDDSGDDPAYGESWGPKDGEWKLFKWRYGFTIVGNTFDIIEEGETYTTTKAFQEEVNSFLCKFNAEFSADGGTGAVSVYDGNQGDTSIDVSGCVNRTGLVCDSDTWGEARWLGGTWFVQPWECPA